MPAYPQAPLPRDFLDVIASRIGTYTGDPHHAERSATLRYSGQDLARRMTELMVEPLRRHADAADGPDRDSIRTEYDSVRRRLIQHLSLELSRVATDRTGSPLQRGQHARAAAERVFAGMLDHVQPVAVQAREPRAVGLDEQRRAEAALAVVNGVAGPGPSDAGLAARFGEDYLPRARDLAATMAADPAGDHSAELRDFAASMTNRLRILAGDRSIQPRARAEEERIGRRTPVPAPSQTLHDGVAIAWVDVQAQEIAGALELPGAVADELSRIRPPYRWEGAMADGLADTIARATEAPGRPDDPRLSVDEVLDRMHAAGQDLGEHPQWNEAARLLVGSREDGDQLRSQVSAAMRSEYDRQYYSLRGEEQFRTDGVPARRAELVGADIARAGVAVVESADRAARDRETGLRTAVGAGLLPESGRRGDPGTAARSDGGVASFDRSARTRTGGTQERGTYR